MIDKFIQGVYLLLIFHNSSVNFVMVKEENKWLKTFDLEKIEHSNSPDYPDDLFSFSV